MQIRDWRRRERERSNKFLLDNRDRDDISLATSDLVPTTRRIDISSLLCALRAAHSNRILHITLQCALFCVRNHITSLHSVLEGRSSMGAFFLCSLGNGIRDRVRASMRTYGTPGGGVSERTIIPTSKCGGEDRQRGRQERPAGAGGARANS